MGRPASLLCVSVCQGGSERGQCCCLASGGLPSTHPISSHFIYFPPVTGALPAAALLVKPKVGGFAYILSLCRPFKWQKSGSFFHHPGPPLVFTARGNEDLSSRCWRPGLCVWPGAGIALSQGIPPDFYPPHMNEAPSIPLLPQPLHATLCLWPSSPLHISCHLDECGIGIP